MPPVWESYQLMEPMSAAAEIVTCPLPQRTAGVVEVITGIGLMIASTAILFDVQPAAEVVSA